MLTVLHLFMLAVLGLVPAIFPPRIGSKPEEGENPTNG
jgi:hypothetical protein